MFGLKGKSFSDPRIVRAAVCIALAFLIWSGLAGVVRLRLLLKVSKTSLRWYLPDGLFGTIVPPLGTTDWFQGNPPKFSPPRLVLRILMSEPITTPRGI